MKGRNQYFHDSRLVLPGGTYVAIRGERVDGHDYLKQAAERGAVTGVVSDAYDGPTYGLDLIKVADPVRHLQELASEVVAAQFATCVAITGSVGKTTTKEFCKVLLSKEMRVWAAPGNQNSQVGLPTALLNMEGDYDLLLLEMGMSEAGELSRLVEMAPPQIALITSVHPVHMSNFTSEQEIAAAKGEIFSHPRTHVGLVPEELAYLEIIEAIGECDKKRYPAETEEGWHLAHHLLGSYSAACAIANELGVTACPDGLEPVIGRGSVHKGAYTVIDETYNACEASVCGALDNLARSSGRKIAVLGTMHGLGSAYEAAHRAVGLKALTCADHLFAYGDGVEPLVKVFKEGGGVVEWFLDKQALIERLGRVVDNGDTVLVKGSRVMGLEAVVEALI